MIRHKVYTIIVVSILMGLAGQVAAQTPDNTSVRPAATATGLPAAYTGSGINYIRIWEPSMPTNDPAVVTGSTSTSEVKQSTRYFDGLGRPLQTVTKAISPGGKDLVSPVRYDDFGREQYKYLPYVPQSGTNISDGTFKKNAFSGQQGFYQDVSLNPAANGETIYYGQTEYEASPLNRVLKVYAPGNSWAKEGGNKPVEQQYLTNTTADEVRIWDMPASGNIPTSASARVYGAGALYKSVSKDERGLRSAEFRDKDNRVVLKRVELTPNAADGHANWLNTYYVYDDLGRLRFVISPKAVDLIRPNWVIDNNIANGLCFQYTYDSRNRMITKKVPGAEMVEMVYDLRDRLVFSRDGNMRSATDKKWLVTFYDALNRPVMVALYASNATRDALQTTMNTATGNTQSIDYTFPGRADLVLGNYDGVTHLYQATNSIELVDGFDAGTGADIVLEINTGINQGQVAVNATNPLPNIDENALTPLTYTFYDNYSFPGAQAAITQDFGLPQPGNNSYREDITGTSSMTKGLVTGTKVKVLGTSDWLTVTTYYNDKGRVIQTVSDNAVGGKDVVTNLYDFNGKLLSSYLRHRNPRSGATAQTTLRTMLGYDAAGRLLTVTKRLNDNPDWERIVTTNIYDELGQLQTKRLGIKGTGTPLETQLYEYNIRGWLKAMNKNYVNTTASSNWFGQELSYDYGFTVKQYNGNIAGSKWKSGGDKIARAYGYSYDNASRLTAAEFRQQNTGSTNWTQDQKNFSVSGITYDANGNIGAMTQIGVVGAAAPGTIDQLTYSYESNSNQLASVTDNILATSTPGLGDFDNGNTSGADYDYDDNGNLRYDLNKNISAISYNHLNLPENITISGKGSIQYQYDALGNKLKKTVVDNTATPSKTTVSDYIGGFVYQNNVQELVSHEEGRMRPVIANGQLSSYVYDYFLKDHLGNVRTVLTDQADLGIYTATMETQQAATETALFSNIEETRAVKPAGYPQDETTPKNEYVAKLNAKEGGKKIGPSLVLKVMAGDTIQIGARAFYKSTGPKNNKGVTPEDMVTNLIQAFGGDGGARFSHGAGQAENLSPFRNLNGSTYQRLKERSADQNQPDKPKAYLNFVLFDDQFNLVEENSGVRQVKGEPDQLQTLAVDKMPIMKNGFLYVYTSNETQQDVLFDNVTVLAATGPLLEETHYYPFGLTMAGISSNVLKGTSYLENRTKFNHGSELQSKEFSDGSGLELYETPLRSLDPQIGRWLQIDPKPNEMFSPYVAMANNPILYSDPSGDTTWFFGTAGQFLGVINDNLANQVHFMNDDDPETKPFDASKLGTKDARKLAKKMRSVSIAFMGTKTAADLQAISKHSDAIDKEIGFVGSIGADKEIRLTALPVDGNNYRKSVVIGEQLDKNYSEEQQANFFLFGHMHHGSLQERMIAGDGSPMARQLDIGRPSDEVDYKPMLPRKGDLENKRQSPALLGTPYGVTVYGTGTGLRYVGPYTKVNNPVEPTKRAYLIYSNLKN